ncbi:hypothetical protein DFH09DRAFT_1508909 [Mycena vulgaris]|nr:hypothetical protein DFH09DRAFT_1508909 [Mycena vulgaris]
MCESERHGTNGTLWYILGVNFALTFYPIDVATVAILVCVLRCSCSHIFWLRPPRRSRDTSIPFPLPLRLPPLRTPFPFLSCPWL